MLSAPLGRKGQENEPRDPLTVRNCGRVLDDIYRYAQANGLFPRGLRRPTEGAEYRAEIAGALKEKTRLGRDTRVPCPTETVRRLVHCEDVSEWRRVVTRTAFFTGARPGELHAWRIHDYRKEFGVHLLDVREQKTLSKKGFDSRLTPPKTSWGRRKVPVHRSLVPVLDAWLARGWQQHVGRKPEADDFLFPDANGESFRETSSVDFLDDLRRAGCETTHKGVTLDRYGLRHAFATNARRAGISSDARDRLLGHRPKDVKSLHYEDEDELLPSLHVEIEKLPALLDEVSATASPAEPSPPIEPLPNPEVLVASLVTESGPLSGGCSTSVMISAEEEGFEPTVPLRVRRFSKPVP